MKQQALLLTHHFNLCYVFSVGDGTTRTIYIASDHGGFDLKTFLIDQLQTRGYTVEDLGPGTHDPNDDYPDYAKKVAEKISTIQANSMGVVICKNGVGVSIVANRYPGVRCALSWTSDHIKSARNDDNANVLALPAEYISKEIALQLALTFLTTPFSNEAKYVRRLNKL
jgi:ribose 5-phosphate isomerase B